MTLHIPKIDGVDFFGLLLCASAVMEYVPGPSVRTGVFVLFFLVFTIGTFPGSRIRASVDSTGFFILAFVGFGASSLLWGGAQGVRPEEWFRGITPFLFLLTWFAFTVDTAAARYRLLHWLCAGSLVWALRIFVEAGYRLYTGDIFVVMRLTGVLFDSVIPFGLMALPLFAYGLSQHCLKYRLSAIALLSVLILWAGYRSMTIIVLASLLFAAPLVGRRAVAAMAGFSLAGGAVLLGRSLDHSVLGMLMDRLASTSATTEMSRLYEWAYALESFVSSPVIGNGIGWQVPYYVTLAGATPEEVIGGVIPESAGYVHNAVAYMLMDLGGVGLSLYLLIFFSAAWSARSLRGDTVRIAAFASLISLLIFCQVQACFRMVQVNLMFIGLLKLLRSGRLLLEQSSGAGGASPAPLAVSDATPNGEAASALLEVVKA